MDAGGSRDAAQRAVGIVAAMHRDASARGDRPTHSDALHELRRLAEDDPGIWLGLFVATDLGIDRAAKLFEPPLTYGALAERLRPALGALGRTAAFREAAAPADRALEALVISAETSRYVDLSEAVGGPQALVEAGTALLWLVVDALALLLARPAEDACAWLSDEIARG